MQDGQVVDVLQAQADLGEPVQDGGLWQQDALPLLQRSAQVTCSRATGSARHPRTCTCVTVLQCVAPSLQ